MAMDTDRIEKEIVLKAPRARVWRALTNADELGAWFGAVFDAPFRAGQPTPGRIAPTKVDAEVAKLQAPYAGMPMVLLVETLEPETTFAFRWHPDPVDPTSDPTGQPTTLVTFRLEEVPGGTKLTITETGFDSLPDERRRQARESNEGGWAQQCRMIERYLAHGS